MQRAVQGAESSEVLRSEVVSVGFLFDGWFGLRYKALVCLIGMGSKAGNLHVVVWIEIELNDLIPKGVDLQPSVLLWKVYTELLLLN